jgi:hypothetical protein
MSDATHYVVLGVSITDREEVKKFFSINEEFYKFLDGYKDNSYQEKITDSESGIHVISDGMSGKYVVVGKILAKGIESGLPFTEVDEIAEQYCEFYKHVRVLDRVLGTKFGTLSAKIIAFTHWH